VDATRSLKIGSSIVRIFVAALGVLVLIIGAYGATGELERLRVPGVGAFSVPDAAVFVSLLAAFLTGGLLLAEAPIKLRLPRLKPRPVQEARPSYGFVTILAVGIGSTLGSPLFLLIPLNVVEYSIVSVISLVIAMILSIAMAKNNAYSYAALKERGLSAVGGPAFVRGATGARSARYFIARVTMALANTTLAAYCVLVFVLFIFGYLPHLLQGYGLGGIPTYLIVGVIAILFAIWFIMNSILERRFMRTIGLAQLAFTSVLVAILVAQSYLLGSAGSWDFRGLFDLPGASGLDWIWAVLVNTAYLYLLFFGFQEIQALDREALDKTRIPVISWIWKGYVVEKKRYFGVAMVLTVLIAGFVNIFYALAVFAVHPSAASLSASQIPALFVAESFLGRPHEVLIALAFMIATFTTFVPAFLAATRHFGALGEDGFLPASVGRWSWLLVLAAIGFLAAAGQAFLVSITDYMVLVSLGIIALAAIWLRRNRKKAVERKDSLALGVGLACFIAAAALYVVEPAVAVFGSISIAIAFLIYDFLELGAIGTKLFVAVLDIVTFLLLSAYPSSFPASMLPVLPGMQLAVDGTAGLRIAMLAAAAILMVSVVSDVVLRKSGQGLEKEEVVRPLPSYDLGEVPAQEEVVPPPPGAEEEAKEGEGAPLDEEQEDADEQAGSDPDAHPESSDQS